MHKVENWHVLWINRNKLSKLDLEGGYTGNIYPIYVSISGPLIKRSLILDTCIYFSTLANEV